MKISMSLKHAFLVGMFICPIVSHAEVAYIPQTLKQCVSIVNEVIDADDYKKSFDELCSIIAENRMLASDVITRQAIVEALAATKRNHYKFENDVDCDMIKKYLKKYLKSLSETSILLTVDGDHSFAQAWPTSLVRKSVLNEAGVDASASFDLMRLSSELASLDAIALCGDVSDVCLTRSSSVEQSISAIYQSFPVHAVANSDVCLSRNRVASSMFSVPGIVIGTGASSPVINVWSLSSSALRQCPLIIQFAAPCCDLKAKQAVSLDLHFLVKRHAGAEGNARVELKIKYEDQAHCFNRDSVHFSEIISSHNFKVIEPNSFEEVKHMHVTIPFENYLLPNQDLALSLRRIEPTLGCEYRHDIYLAAVVLKYSSKD